MRTILKLFSIAQFARVGTHTVGNPIIAPDVDLVSAEDGSIFATEDGLDIIY